MRLLFTQSEGKRPLGISRLRRGHFFRSYRKDVVFGGEEWIQLAEDVDQYRAFVHTVMNFKVP